MHLFLSPHCFGRMLVSFYWIGMKSHIQTAENIDVIDFSKVSNAY